MRLITLLVLLTIKTRLEWPEVEFVVDGPDVALVRGASTELARAVANLLSNAGRHAKTRVEVLVTRADAVRLTVINDGTRIAPQDRERIFDRLAQLDDARSDRFGGLGLAIVKRVAERCGGSVGATELRGRTAFVLTLTPADHEQE